MRQITKGEEEVTSLDGNRFVAITFTFFLREVCWGEVRVAKMCRQIDTNFFLPSATYLASTQNKMPLYPTDFVHFADSTGSYHFYHSTLGD